MFYSFVTLFGVLSQYFNSDPLRYCYLTPKVLRSGGLGKELIVFGITPGDLQTLKVSVPAVALRLCGIRRVPPALPESAAVLACRQRILGLSKCLDL